MSVDVFGRKLERGGSVPGPPGIGFILTSDGQYDVANKRICNLDNPKDQFDAVNLGYFQQKIDRFIVNLLQLQEDWRKFKSYVNFQLEEQSKQINAFQTNQSSVGSDGAT